MTMPLGDYPDPMTQEVDLGYQQGWDDAMAQKPPCACRGAKVLAEAKTTISDGWVLASVKFDQKIGGVDRPVRILVFDDSPGEKPCS